MEVRETGIRDLKIIKPGVFQDSRGYFFESYNEGVFRDAGMEMDFVQDNQSRSSFGVVRGLHYQLEPRAQTKLVRVLEGSIWDVAVDLRKNSPTYLEWRGVELSADNFLQLLIPRGFAHGFSVLSETAVVFYKCDDLYAPDHEAGIRYDDTEIGVDWKIGPGDMKLSERDLGMPLLKDAKMNFEYQ
jgi:dTDP-4-dehydrorhamnose 3,5-epimerase